MLLLNAPAALNRIIFAVIGRVVKQLNRLSSAVGKRDHPIEKLGANATAFRAIIDLELDDLNFLLD